MLLGIDIGTSATKTVLFTPEGEAVASHTIGYPLSQPHDGWSEQDPQDWWQAVSASIKKVMSDSGTAPDKVMGIGLSGQMNGIVLLDKDGKPLRPAILWCDQRATEEAEQMNRLLGGKQHVIDLTGNMAIPGLAAAKILWVQNHQPEIYEKTAHILVPKDYIRYRLTGEYATEVSDASGMQLLDIQKRDWSDEVLTGLHIDRALLGKMHESPDVTGVLHRRAAEECGLVPGIPVVGGAGDNPAAGVGMGAMEQGRAFTTIGTSGVPYMLTEKVLTDPQGRINCLCAAAPNKWMLMGCIQSAGFSLKWLRDTVCGPEIAQSEKEGVDPFVVMDREAATVPPGSRGLLFLPYLMGERSPHADADCRGVFFGLSATHTRSEMIRAVMEGVSYSMRECIDIYNELGCKLTDMRICGGGGKSPLWRQILSDIYGSPISCVQASEGGAALGVAILAGVGTGLFASVEQGCEALIRPAQRHEPSAAAHAQYEGYYALHKKLYQDLYQDFKLLADLPK